MEHFYTAFPFLGSVKSGASPQTVADQMEIALNAVGSSGPACIFRVLAPVSIQIQPGCIARLFGAESASARYDQIVMGPASVDLDIAIRSVSRHQDPTDQTNSLPTSIQQLPPNADDGRSNPADSFVRTWTRIPPKIRFAGLGAASLVLVWWLASPGSNFKPPPELVSPRSLPAPPAPPHQTAVRPVPLEKVPPGQASSAASLVPRPSLRVGDRWLSEITDHQDARQNYRSERSVIEVNDDRILTTVRTLKSDFTRTVEYDANWALRSSRHPNGSATVYSPALPYMRFPAEPGRTWSERVVETSSSGAERVHQIQAAIVRWEPVTVPAGTFQALRVELSDQVLVNGAVVSSGTDVSWYVPQVKRSVKSEETSLDAATGERRRRTIALLEYVAQ